MSLLDQYHKLMAKLVQGDKTALNELRKIQDEAQALIAEGRQEFAKVETAVKKAVKRVKKEAASEPEVPAAPVAPVAEPEVAAPAAEAPAAAPEAPKAE